MLFHPREISCRQSMPILQFQGDPYLISEIGADNASTDNHNALRGRHVKIGDND
jgi:hypothetical protein